MDYNFPEIEQKWRKRWQEQKTYKVTDDSQGKKFYVLDMFPYPSGAGLHVGHPLGYIASDIIARYKKHQGFNVLHPMGYDSFGLPAEQYAIQTGQHPEITTETNIKRYREQLDKIGFAYDWDREVRTSNPDYYRWTQWIFGEIYQSWYNKDTDKAEPISTLIKKFEGNGTYGVNAAMDEKWHEEIPSDKFFFGEKFSGEFTATDWKSMNEEQQQLILMNFRLAYLADSVVNWCPALGTVLANDEIKDGVSERGGHPVIQKKMRQWSMRISAYAERLLQGLETIDWNESIKEVQRNWIGRSDGASVRFQVDGHNAEIEVFTTRPDTIFGVSFMTLAPEHEFVMQITTEEYKKDVIAYIDNAKLKTERDRQSDVKNVSGQFTGAHVLHPFTGEKIQVWIGEYVLAGYGTGAVMAVPCGDQRDYDFAKKFNLAIPNILKDVDISEKAEPSKDAILCNSQMLDGLSYKAATKKIIEEIEARGIGKGKTNYRMRDAVFSRQRYWGEPFPVYYKNEIPYLLDENDPQVTLPAVDKYLPTEDGEPPLARANRDAWNVWKGDRMEYNTMPGWAGSSWYFLRYMDPQNKTTFASREKTDYWNQVDLYMGGAEHGTGHLLYSRFWTKILFDLGHIGFDEPFKKMINQGMILGVSMMARVINLHDDESYMGDLIESLQNIDIKTEVKESNQSENKSNKTTAYLLQQNVPVSGLELRIRMPIDYVRFENGNYLIDENYLNELQKAYPQYRNYRIADSKAIERHLSNNLFTFSKQEIDSISQIADLNRTVHLEPEIEKMSKSKFNVQTPDDLVEKFGADTLRLYEMFLGPVEQSKPWDTKSINGVHNFLRKLWRLYHDQQNNVAVSDDAPTKDELKSLHKTIKKISEDLDRYSWNTCVSAFMICVNELQEQKCNKRSILEPLTVLISPFAPHIAEELWEILGHTTSVTKASWPAFDEANLKDDAFDYPVSFNGKTRYFLPLGVELSPAEVEAAVRANDNTAKYLEGKEIKKIIVVQKRIVNVVI